MWQRGFIILVSFCAVIVTPASWAWSAKGHAVIAEAALKTLPTSQQRYFNTLATALLNNDAEQKAKTLKSRNLKGLSPFARVAAWPDVRRSPTVTTLFNRYAKSDVPAPLKSFAPYATSRWHYVNQSYWQLDKASSLSAGTGCSIKPSGDLAKVWRPLLASFSLAKNDAERGLLVAMLAHLLADAYQPLHTMASVDSRCKSDAGGNGYCLVNDKKGRCKLNLHQLWDGGFNVFDYPLEGLKAPKTRTKIDADVLIDNAIALMPRSAAQIYSLPKGREPTKAYRIKASLLVSEQTRAASSALAQLLSVLYTEAHHAR